MKKIGDIIKWLVSGAGFILLFCFGLVFSNKKAVKADEIKGIVNDISNLSPAGKIALSKRLSRR